MKIDSGGFFTQLQSLMSVTPSFTDTAWQKPTPFFGGLLVLRTQPSRNPSGSNPYAAELRFFFGEGRDRHAGANPASARAKPGSCFRFVLHFQPLINGCKDDFLSLTPNPTVT